MWYHPCSPPTSKNSITQHQALLARHSTVSTLVPNEPRPPCAGQTEIHIHRLFQSCRAYELSQ